MSIYYFITIFTTTVSFIQHQIKTIHLTSENYSVIKLCTYYFITIFTTTVSFKEKEH